ncbi:glycosyltransferase family 2 protein [Anaerostipes sp. 494a]|uniref:glycosyltransferase family 2 protein n=1 Tax=Anaerostipes sp. 494a TaxID=1261636 RepID=UPI0009F9DCD7|nr:glycosyltransferase family 2 protein [Anaerostipes sp. 494a]
MELLISVIVPAYNIENYIERSIRSIMNQTYSNLEIIIIDDGSTDATGTIIDRLAKEDQRIIPIHKKNEGVSAARNTGLDIAKGEYIGFVDGDDYIGECMYDHLLSNAIRYKADISHCGYQMVFPNRIDYYYNTGELLVQDNYQGVYDLIKADKVEPGLCNKLYRREVIGGNRLDERIRINEDLLFNYFLFKKSSKSVFEDIPFYHYMVRDNSAATSSMNIHKMEDPLKVIHIISKLEEENIKFLLEKRYTYLLEKVSSMRIDNKNCELKEVQRRRRIELCNLLSSNRLKANYSKKEMLQLKLAAYFPAVYRLLNYIYGSMTGSRNRYKV